MSRIINLKNTELKFNRISIRDDYSAYERKLIKEKVEEAAMKKKTENTEEYNDRGEYKTVGAWYELPSEYKGNKFNKYK